MFTKVIYFLSQLISTIVVLIAWFIVWILTWNNTEIYREFDMIISFIWKSIDD